METGAESGVLQVTNGKSRNAFALSVVVFNQSQSIRLDIYRLRHTRQSARSSPGRADAEDGSVYIEACHTQQPQERERGDWRESRMEWNMGGRMEGGKADRAGERAARVRDSGWHGSRHLCNGPRIVSRLVARLGSGRCHVSREST